MLSFAGIYLLVIASDPNEIGLKQMPDMRTCEQARLSPKYHDPRFRRVECLAGAAIVSESLVNATVDRLRGTLDNMFQPYK